MTMLSREEQVREDVLFQNRKIRTIPMRFTSVPDPAVAGQFYAGPGSPLNVPAWLRSINQPLHEVAHWTADETVQFRGCVLSAVPVPLQDYMTLTFVLSTSATAAPLAYSNNAESTWAELFADATRPCILPFWMQGEYDGFYLNAGETIKLYFSCGDNWAAAVHGYEYQEIQGTMMVYFLPTYRQRRS